MASYDYLLEQYSKLQKKIYVCISNNSSYEELDDYINKFEETANLFRTDLSFNINYRKLKEKYLISYNYIFENRLAIIELINQIRENINDMQR